MELTKDNKNKFRHGFVPKFVLTTFLFYTACCIGLHSQLDWGTQLAALPDAANYIFKST